MIETGTVVKVEGNTAKVRVERRAECSKCGMCGMKKNAAAIEILAENAIGAKSGNTVVIETQKDAKLLGILLVFLVPLLLIGGAVWLGFLINSEIWILIFSLIFIVVWYTILAILDKQFLKIKGFCPQIIEIKEIDTNE